MVAQNEPIVGRSGSTCISSTCYIIIAALHLNHNGSIDKNNNINYVSQVMYAHLTGIHLVRLHCNHLQRDRGRVDIRTLARPSRLTTRLAQQPIVAPPGNQWRGRETH